MKPAELVASLILTTPDLNPRIGTLTRTWTAADTKISARFHYVRFRDSKPTVDELITAAHARLINFVIPRSRIAEVRKQLEENPDTMDPWVILSTEARDLFIKTEKESGRSGELGGILLYMLLEWVLKAPIVACKMYLKTAQQMPVHGNDGIHLGHQGEQLLMYWGESKLHKALSSALSSIAESISKHTGSPIDYQNEIRIIRSNLNLDGVNQAVHDALKAYFNPYDEKNNHYADCYACLAGFDSELYDQVGSLSHNECESEFARIFEDRVEDICQQITEKIRRAHLTKFRFAYFLMPFPSVDEARQKFQAKLWGKK